MKKSEFKSYIKKEIFEILSEDAQKAADQKAYNVELEKTKQLHKDLDITEEEIAEVLSSLNENEDIPVEYIEIAKLYLTSKGHDSEVVPELTLKAMGRIIIDKFYNGNIEKAHSDLSTPGSIELEKTKELMKENISQEVINKVSRFVTSLANYYGYSEQDAVYAIMQALKAHSADFQGLNEEEGIPSVYTDKDLDNLLSIVLKYVKDPNDAEKEIERFDTGGFDAMSDYVTANLLRDKDYNDWYNKLHSIKEEEMDDEEMDKAATSAAKKGDSISKVASKLGETTREMKSLVNKYKKAQEPEKSELMARLKELTKIKKELESLL